MFFLDYCPPPPQTLLHFLFFSFFLLFLPTSRLRMTEAALLCSQNRKGGRGVECVYVRTYVCVYLMCLTCICVMQRLFSMYLAGKMPNWPIQILSGGQEKRRE